MAGAWPQNQRAAELLPLRFFPLEIERIRVWEVEYKRNMPQTWLVD